MAVNMPDAPNMSSEKIIFSFSCFDLSGHCIPFNVHISESHFKVAKNYTNPASSKLTPHKSWCNIRNILSILEHLVKGMQQYPLLSLIEGPCSLLHMGTC